MELFSANFFSALFSIVVIDLVLAGDNAIVIGLAARNLPASQQKRAIIWGTVGAVIIRVLATMAVVWLLKIPGLMLAGGLMLIWIAYKLLTEEKHDENVEAGNNLFAAIRTIIIADAAMGLDNVLGVAGAAHGNYLLVIFGLMISIPIVVWGSTFCIKCMDRFPGLIYIGAGILAWTAVKMIVDEPMIRAFFITYPVIKWVLTILVIGGVLFAGNLKKRQTLGEA